MSVSNGWMVGRYLIVKGPMKQPWPGSDNILAATRKNWGKPQN